MARRASMTPESHPRQVLIISSVMVTIGLIIPIAMSIPPLLRSMWPQTGATITRADLQPTGSWTGRTDALFVEYEYLVNDDSYVGERYYLSNSSSKGRGTRPDRLKGEAAAAFVRDHPIGARIWVYYAPSNPRTSCISPSLPTATWVILAFWAAGVLLFGFTMIPRCIHHLRRRAKKSDPDD